MFVHTSSNLRTYLLRAFSRRTYVSRNERITAILNAKKELEGPGLQREAEFQHSKSGSFYQDAPCLENQFLGDAFLRSSLKRILPAEVGNVWASFCELGFGGGLGGRVWVAPRT